MSSFLRTKHCYIRDSNYGLFLLYYAVDLIFPHTKSYLTDI